MVSVSTRTARALRKPTARKAVPAKKATSAKAASLRVAAANQLKIFRMLPGAELGGGIYAGLTYTDSRIEALIVGPEYDGELDWAAAVEWATKLRVGPYDDFTLMNRIDARIAMANVAHLFKPTVYWLREQHASHSDGAWGQGFSNGYQHYWDKDRKLRARVVRRLPL